MKHQALFEIIENRPLTGEDFLMKLRPQEVGATDAGTMRNRTLKGNHVEQHQISNNTAILEELLPGQFVQVLIPHSSDTFLRRPISICDVDLQNRLLYLYIKKVGKGTAELRKCQRGEKLDILLPLGNGFKYEQSRRPLLLGGGVGIAPMVYLSKKIAEKGIRPTVLLAGKTAENLTVRSLFDTEKCDLQLCTDDGSLGEKGMITQHSLMQKPTDYDTVFCCGPTPMMKAVARMMEAAGIPCHVSLENHMACGVGACLCCVTPTKAHGNQCVCTEGPVFDSKELAW
ncbi:MAG: dihydroorotate dehydrogenase electron transfer subunit [Bacteroidales bacterium]|nr:dihydroorotate dehydrogenase electron transfer subunit [Bacteroidales bacterium]